MEKQSKTEINFQGAQGQMTDLQAKIKKLQDARDELQKKIQLANDRYQESLSKLK